MSGSQGGERPAGFLSDVRSHFRNSKVPESAEADIQEQVLALHMGVGRARSGVYDFFNMLLGFIRDHGPASTGAQYDQSLRITPGVRRQPDWDQVEVLWSNLALQTQDGQRRSGKAAQHRWKSWPTSNCWNTRT